MEEREGGGGREWRREGRGKRRCDEGGTRERGGGAAQ